MSSASEPGDSGLRDPTPESPPPNDSAAPTGEEPAPGTPHPTSRAGRRPAGKSFLTLFPQLFLVPLLLVTIAVLVYLFFHASAYDTRSVSDIIRDMQSAGAHARKQSAFKLAQIVKEREARAGGKVYFTREETGLLIHLLKQFPDDEFTRSYAIKTLGRAGEPERTLPVLTAALTEAGTRTSEKAAAIQALGFTRSSEAVDPLLAVLPGLNGPDDWELRLYAINALVNLVQSTGTHVSEGAPTAPAHASGASRLSTERIARALRPYVNDPQREVRWNTAYYLAAYFDDPHGIGILRDLTDIDVLNEQRGDRNRRLTGVEMETWIRLGLRGLEALDEGRSTEELEEIRALARRNGWTHLLNEVHAILAERERGRGEPGDERGAPAPTFGADGKK